MFFYIAIINLYICSFTLLMIAAMNYHGNIDSGLHELQSPNQY